MPLGPTDDAQKECQPGAGWVHPCVRGGAGGPSRGAIRGTFEAASPGCRSARTATWNDEAHSTSAAPRPTTTRTVSSSCRPRRPPGRRPRPRSGSTAVHLYCHWSKRRASGKKCRPTTRRWPAGMSSGWPVAFDAAITTKIATSSTMFTMPTPRFHFSGRLTMRARRSAPRGRPGPSPRRSPRRRATISTVTDRARRHLARSRRRKPTPGRTPRGRGCPGGADSG